MAQKQAREYREYETIYIMPPQVSNDEAARVAKRFAEIVDKNEGKLLRVDNWGRRRLAYPIRKQLRGNFVYVRFCGTNELVAEVERNLRNLDNVMRYQTVLLSRHVDPGAFKVEETDVAFTPTTVNDDERDLTLEEQLGLHGGFERTAQNREVRVDESESAASEETPSDAGRDAN